MADDSGSSDGGSDSGSNDDHKDNSDNKDSGSKDKPTDDGNNNDNPPDNTNNPPPDTQCKKPECSQVPHIPHPCPSGFHSTHHGCTKIVIHIKNRNNNIPQAEVFVPNLGQVKPFNCVQSEAQGFIRCQFEK
jgi:hypothetical protein